MFRLSQSPIAGADCTASIREIVFVYGGDFSASEGGSDAKPGFGSGWWKRTTSILSGGIGDGPGGGQTAPKSRRQNTVHAVGRRTQVSGTSDKAQTTCAIGLQQLVSEQLAQPCEQKARGLAVNCTQAP